MIQVPHDDDFSATTTTPPKAELKNNQIRKRNLEDAV
jgi:hypothetical protein